MPVGTSVVYSPFSLRLYFNVPPVVLPAVISGWAVPLYTKSVLAAGAVTVGFAFAIANLSVSVAVSVAGEGSRLNIANGALSVTVKLTV